MKNNRKYNKIYRVTRRTEKLAETAYNHFKANENLGTLSLKDEAKYCAKLIRKYELFFVYHTIL